MVPRAERGGGGHALLARAARGRAAVRHLHPRGHARLELLRARRTSFTRLPLAPRPRCALHLDAAPAHATSVAPAQVLLHGEAKATNSKGRSDTLGPGSYFGEEALNEEGNTAPRRDSTVTALCECHGLRLVSADVHAAGLHDISAGVSADAIARELKRVPFFGNLSPEQRGVLSHHFKMRATHISDLLFEQGEPARAMYVLLEGRVTITRVGIAAPIATVLCTDERPWFGELALYKKEARSATARCDANCKLLVLELLHFGAFLDAIPTFKDMLDVDIKAFATMDQLGSLSRKEKRDASKRLVERSLDPREARPQASHPPPPPPRPRAARAHPFPRRRTPCPSRRAPLGRTAPPVGRVRRRDCRPWPVSSRPRAHAPADHHAQHARQEAEGARHLHQGRPPPVVGSGDRCQAGRYQAARDRCDEGAGEGAVGRAAKAARRRGEACGPDVSRGRDANQPMGRRGLDTLCHQLGSRYIGRSAQDTSSSSILRAGAASGKVVAGKSEKNGYLSVTWSVPFIDPPGSRINGRHTAAMISHDGSSQ